MRLSKFNVFASKIWVGFCVGLLEGCVVVAALPGPCSRVHDWRSSGLPALVKLGLACPHPEGLPGEVHRANGVQVVERKGAVVGGGGRWLLRGPPRTTSRRHRPHSGLSLTHSTPGDHTLVRPPGHWLRPHLSRPLGTTSVPWDKTVGSNQTTVSDESRWSQVCRPRGQRGSLRPQRRPREAIRRGIIQGTRLPAPAPHQARCPTGSHGSGPLPPAGETAP